jgi:hypothetical protein
MNFQQKRLFHNLALPDVRVKVREDLNVSIQKTLEILDRYIHSCDGLINLVLSMNGVDGQGASGVGDGRDPS